MQSYPVLYKRENKMAETSSETISQTDKVYNELSKMRHEGLFCRRCSCYCATKDEFNQHVQEHLKETNNDKESFMRYIENYICSKCGQQFEVKSDLIIHYNTVCIDALYRCKHCRENCENSPFLQMHLVVHHRYSEEMLRDEGYLTDLDDNPFLSECSFMTSFKNKAFKPIPPEFNNAESSKLSNSYSRKSRKSRKTASERKNLAFNLLDKTHSCWICNESFSRKCVLEIHIEKHSSTKNREKKLNRGIAGEKGLSMKVSENNSTLTKTAMQSSVNIGTSEDTKLLSNVQRTILKPSNVVFRSSLWKKVKPKRNIRGVKSYVSTRNATRKREITRGPAACSQGMPLEKNKKTEFSKVTTQNASNTNSPSQSSDEIAVPVAWKKIKLKSKIRNAVASDKQKDSENSNITKQSVSSKTRQSKSSKTKRCKETSKNEEKQVFECELCKKQFKDGYKLRRHFLIHTGARPYTCTLCKKTFARDDHMKRHMKRVCSKTVNSQNSGKTVKTDKH